MTTHPPKLTLYAKIGWGIGDIGIACYVVATVGYLLFFLTQAHSVSPAWAGIGLLVPRLVDVITDPIMGAISDRTNTRMGRRRPYLLLGSFLFAVTFMLMFQIPGGYSEQGKLIYFTLMYILASTAYTIYNIPHAAMAAEMSTSYKERTNLVGYKMIGARAGVLIVGVLGPYVFSSQDTLEEGFQVFGQVYAVVILISGLIAFVATKDAPRIERVEPPFHPLTEMRAIAKNKDFTALLLVFLLQNIAIGAAATMAVYFMTIYLGIKLEHIGWWMAIGGVVAIIATPIWMAISRKIGKTKMYVIAILIELAIYILFLIAMQPGAIVLYVILLIILGFGDAACQLAPNSMVPDTVEAGELQTGSRREGTIFGAMSLCLKLGMAMGAFLASQALDHFDFVPGESVMLQTPEAIDGIRVAYSVLPIVLWVAALLALRRYRLDEDRFNDIKAKLARTQVRRESDASDIAQPTIDPAVGAPVVD